MRRAPELHIRAIRDSCKADLPLPFLFDLIDSREINCSTNNLKAKLLENEY
jgi:hypothetical protein